MKLITIKRWINIESIKYQGVSKRRPDYNYYIIFVIIAVLIYK